MGRFLHIILFFFLFFLAPEIVAQKERDKVEALHYDFISKRMQLTGAESERFWPMYNEYNDKIKAIRINLRQGYKRWSDTFTDKEAEELYLLQLRSKQAEAELYRQYNEKIKEIVGVRKMIRLHLAEEEFKREIIRNIREKE